MLHKAADCNVYWLARDPTDMALHTEDAIYFVTDGEQPQDGDCKHDTQSQSTHLSHCDDRVKSIRSQQHTDICAITREDTNIGAPSADHKGQVPTSTMEKPLTRVRQEGHDKLDQMSSGK